MSADASPRRSFPEIVLSALALPRGMHPARKLTLGYLSYILLGWLVLCLPFAQKGKGVSALDNLFMATSAVSTTGLVTASVSDDYSLFGQMVLLVLIQFGGIGYMTLGSFIILSRRSELPPDRADVGRAAFSLPEGFQIEKFLRSVILFTVLIELAGAMALYPVFARADVASPFWSALFHSVSAFCTAGFSLYNNSMEAFTGNFHACQLKDSLSEQNSRFTALPHGPNGHSEKNGETENSAEFPLREKTRQEECI